MSSSSSLPFYMQFTAGAVAGVSEIMTMYPLDVVKTRLQLQVGSTQSLISTLKQIVQQEGFSRLYRGIVAPILVEAPKRATKFAANEQYTVLYKRLFGVDRATQAISVLTGISAGVTEGLLIVPFELVKIRMQDKHNAGVYKSTWDCAAKIARTEGPIAFYKGLESTLWRHASWNGGYFGVIHFVRQALASSHSVSGVSVSSTGGGGAVNVNGISGGSTQQRTQQRTTVLFNNFVAGAIGGTVGTLLNTPFDVVKTRVQNQMKGGKYGWTWPAILTIAREEGYAKAVTSPRFAALYKGFVPKVLRLGPGGGILLVVFDQVTSLMQQYTQSTQSAQSSSNKQ